MSAKPFSHHEQLRSTELETIKRDVLALLTDYDVGNVTYNPNQIGNSFVIRGNVITDKSFFRTLQQEIAVHYDEHIVFEIENRDALIIEVRDESDQAKPTLN